MAAWGRTWFGVTALLSVCLAAPPLVRAQSEAAPPDPARLNEQAIELSRQGELAEAIEIWWSILESQGSEYKHAAVVHRNIGRNYQKLEQWPEAWYHLDRCVTLAPADARCVEWRAAVEGRLSGAYVKAQLRTDVTSCGVLLGEMERERVYAAPVDWWFKPGVHRLTVVDARLGTRSHSLEPSSQSPHVLSCLQPVPAVSLTTKSIWHERVGLPEWLLVGGGAAAILAGGITWWVASDRLDSLHSEFARDYGALSLTQAEYDIVQREWDSKVSSRVNPLEQGSYALWGIGGAALVSGVVMALLGDDKGMQQPAVSVTPLPPVDGGRGMLLEVPF